MRRLRHMIREARCWVRERVSKQYRHHVVYTGLEPGWHDCDTVMLHACMTILKRYVEWECGGADALASFTLDLEKPGSEGFGPRSVVDAQVSAQSEALTIYHWWTVDRPASVKRSERLLDAGCRLDSPDIDARVALMDLEDRMRDEDQAMLLRLINIRQSLWT